MSEQASLSGLQSLLGRLQANGQTAEGLLELMGELQKHEYLWPFRVSGTDVAAGAVIELDSPEMGKVTRKHVLYFPDDDGGRLAPLITDVGSFAAIQPNAAAQVAYVRLKPFAAWSQVRDNEDCSAAVLMSGSCEFRLSKELVKLLRKHYVDNMGDAAARVEYMLDPD